MQMPGAPIGTAAVLGQDGCSVQPHCSSPLPSVPGAGGDNRYGHTAQTSYFGPTPCRDRGSVLPGCCCWRLFCTSCCCSGNYRTPRSKVPCFRRADASACRPQTAVLIGLLCSTRDAKMRNLLPLGPCSAMSNMVRQPQSQGSHQPGNMLPWSPREQRAICIFLRSDSESLSHTEAQALRGAGSVLALICS